MGRYDEARAEYDKAILVSEASAILLHALYQKLWFIFGKVIPSRGAMPWLLLPPRPPRKKEPNAQFEIALALPCRGGFANELHQLRLLEDKLQNPPMA